MNYLACCFLISHLGYGFEVEIIEELADDTLETREVFWRVEGGLLLIIDIYVIIF